MTHDQWLAVERLFERACELPLAGQSAFLQAECADAALRAEVESLLLHAAAEGQGVEALIQEVAVELSTMEGSRVGPYLVIRELGRGGMGTVYLASRADDQYESEVAIKLVRPGFDTDFILRRFRRERQILARLEHPNIARLLDGGTTADRIPYLVMEYVKGSAINRYAEEHRLGVEQRVRLFLPVCAAVEYAHRAFIVHRDLKPSNILIDGMGRPKLLDFGISKLLHTEPDPADTQGVAMITPAYTSPEQISGGPVTIASDVYSLGAVLYELLTGVRPHRILGNTPQALERAVCHDPIVPPSVAVRDNPALAWRLAGDLDNIVLTALRKEPERRYVSAEHLADDLQRHLEDRPVTARPASLGYRAGKFISRNRLAVTLAGVAAATAASIARLATTEARASQRRLREATGLSANLLSDLDQAARTLPESAPARQIIARIGAQYRDDLLRIAGEFVRKGEP